MIADSRRHRLREIIATRSLLQASQFRLASGRTSSFFFDMKKTIFDPEGAALTGDLLLDLLEADPQPVASVGGLVMGAVPLVSAVLVRAFARQRTLQGFFVRKETKDHGTMALVDGCLVVPGLAVVLEDVTTTGGSALKAATAARAAGATVAKVLTVVDRQEGAAESLAAEGLSLTSLFDRSDFPG